MSIWTSISPDIRAADDVDNFDTCLPNSVETVHVDVATATSWTDRIRLCAYSDPGEPTGSPVDTSVTLTVAAAEQLARNLTDAVARVRATAQHRGA